MVKHRPRSSAAWGRVMALVMAAALPIPSWAAPPAPPSARRLAHLVPGDLFGAPAGAISPDGAVIAFAERHLGRGGRIAELNLGSQRVRALTPDAGSQGQPAWSPDGRRLVYVDFSSGRRGLWVREASNGRERRLYAPEQGQPLHPSWTADGRQVLFTLRDGARTSVWSVALDGGAMQRVPAGEAAISWPTPAPDGTRIALLRDQGGGDSTLWLRELTTGEERQLAQGFWLGWTSGPVWAPDGRTVYLAAARAKDAPLEAWAVSASTGELRRIKPPAPGEVLQVRVTRDGGLVLSLYDVRVRPGTLPAGGGIPRPLLPEGAAPGFLPSWSRDGRMLAYITGNWRRRTFPLQLDIAAVPLSPEAVPAGPPQVLIAEDHEDYGVDWSPDGRFLVFHSHRGGTDDIYLRPARAEEGPIIPLSAFGPGHETGEPVWSPDGRRVAFSSFTPDANSGRSRLFTVEVDPGTGRPTGPPAPVRLEGFDGHAVGARFSPEGRTLAFHARWPDGGAGVCTVPAAGGKVRVVLRHRSDESYSTPEWSREGSALFFASNGGRGPFRIKRVDLRGGRVDTLSQGDESAVQPRLSPDGATLAVTLWQARVEFWLLPPLTEL